MQAEKLQKDGNRLLKAATAAKEEVGNLVTDALEAVVKMDGDLKRDLKEVKEKIKSGINQVITSLGVKELDAKVKDDLGTLRQKIEGLKNNMDDDSKPNELVKQALENLAEEKQTLEKVTHKDTGSIKREMDKLDNNFKTAIQNPLDTKVKEVETAIGTLGGKFSLNGDKMLEKIFGHVKGEVGKIKGKPGQKGSWENNGGQGLDGIQSKVQSYANAFSGDDGGKFNIIVKGWIEETILKHNGAVRKMLDKKFAYDESEKDVFTNVADAFKEQLKSESTEAGEKVVNGNKGAGGGTQKIHGYVNAVKQGCDAFAEALDKKLNSNEFGGIYSEVKQKMQNNNFNATKCICESVGCTNCNGQGSVHKQDCKEKAFIATVLCTVSSVSRQVGNELESVLLAGKTENSIAGILDAVYETTNDLHSQLTAATDPKQGPSNQESPAEAVDSKLKAVRQKVNNDLVNDFNNHVKKPLKTEVEKLPAAVNAFNKSAEQQIKAAAKTAIGKAAGQISDKPSGPIELGDELMNEFKKSHDEIKDKLPKDLQDLLEKHIGRDDPNSTAPGSPKRQPTKVTLAGTFKNYTEHIGIGPLTKFPYGHLDKAIHNIKTVGLAELENTLGDSTLDKNKIDDKTFTVPFGQIKNQVEAIAGLVDNTKGTPPTYHVGDKQNGIKQWLAELKNALSNKNGNALWNGFTKGLEQIQSVINDLQSNPFTSGPKEIGTAVTLIKAELELLRGKLQGKYGNRDDVINALQDLRDNGLERGITIWNGKKRIDNIENYLRQL
ncbi:Extracellular matrix-binding ebh, putative [Babesia ovata]|uniref:Extracellular matrix-binding ebh, putative n=1 Tax=Babesia ovata TaxID=189622 RepID=A0A2H6KB50_9APIC|nr:Extracellular matrix-binding ebh, putative [Babesia ovata]GBE60222.1 Extracellular matrix-binding ebh, putative [Babesia ovata]